MTIIIILIIMVIIIIGVVVGWIGPLFVSYWLIWKTTLK